LYFSNLVCKFIASFCCHPPVIFYVHIETTFGWWRHSVWDLVI
jgi:hypothetical protein